MWHPCRRAEFDAAAPAEWGTYARRVGLERRQPCQKCLIIAPDRLGTGNVRGNGWWLTKTKRRLLRAHCDLCVPVGAIEADMTQLAPNHIDIDTRLEQMDGTRMSKHMWADVVAVRASL